MKITKGDRTILIILIILLAAYVGYASFYPRYSDDSSTIIRDEPQINTSAVEKSDTPLPTPLYDTDSITSPKESPKDTCPIRTEKYPGPPDKGKWTKVSKLPTGATVDLNSADTLLMQRVPGIGPAFARRIFKYRELLGGFYVVEQLQEVYGMDRERYDRIAPYFVIQTPVRPLSISQDSIPRHPYLQWRHRRVLEDLLRLGAPFTWDDLMRSSAFSRDDSLRLAPYLRLIEENSAEINPIP